MTFRRRLILFSATLLLSLALVTGLSLFSAYQYRKIQNSLSLGLELQMVAPRAVIALGATAARSLLGRPITIGESRGHALALDDGTPVWITVHPSYILRQQDDEAREREMHRFVADLRKAMP